MANCTLCLMDAAATTAPAAVAGPGRLQTVGLGKFKACQMYPLANLHYVLAPAGFLQKKDLPPRWGLLSYSEDGISVVSKPTWQEATTIPSLKPPSPAP